MSWWVTHSPNTAWTSSRMTPSGWPTENQKDCGSDQGSVEERGTKLTRPWLNPFSNHRLDRWQFWPSTVCILSTWSLFAIAYRGITYEQLKHMFNLCELLENGLLNVSGGKRGNVNFTPRLGRESGEEVKDSWFSEFYNQKSPPFAPRLGKRRMSVYYFDPTDTQDD